MHPLILACDALLKSQGFDYAFCGGHALDIFLGRATRPHGDIDISAYYEDKTRIIAFMRSRGWAVYEAMGGGKVRLLTASDKREMTKRNLFCVKEICPFFHVKPLGDGVYRCKIKHTEQKRLDFVEFLFNQRSGTEFIYGRDEDVRLALDKAVLWRDGIAYFAPELALLYKSTNLKRRENRRDFDAVLPWLPRDGKLWLKSALPDGHKWISRLEGS